MKHIKVPTTGGAEQRFEPRLSLEDGKWTARLYCDGEELHDTAPATFDYRVDAVEWMDTVMTEMHALMNAVRPS